MEEVLRLGRVRVVESRAMFVWIVVPVEEMLADDFDECEPRRRDLCAVVVVVVVVEVGSRGIDVVVVVVGWGWEVSRLGRLKRPI